MWLCTPLNVGKEDVKTIIDEHLLGGKPVEALKVPTEVW
jgi:(2Fe-2S) ferredoxin